MERGAVLRQLCLRLLRRVKSDPVQQAEID
jgi:hypothetical protein